MYSCLYEGNVRHRRFTPVENAFRYRLFFTYLDLSELPRLFDLHPMWSAERFNIAWFRRQDHLGDPEIPLDRAVRDLVAETLGHEPAGPVRLLTHPRYLGYCFNPVSFYYCFDAGGRDVEAVVTEIHNTPWLEEHCYVFGKATNTHPHEGWRQHHFPKAFHVSPFMEMAIQYDWRFQVPGETIQVHMNLANRDIKRFDATLSLKRVPMTRRSMTRVLLAYPPMTWKVTAMIYFQALRLKLKGAPVYPHPQSAEALTGGENR
jgi:DUF1365 family protein